MPNIIDERVVEMKFDNKQFEQNAQNSLKTLDNLKKSLNFDGAAKGLHQFERISNGIDLSGMNSAIETVQHRFSTLGIVAEQIIRRITDAALGMAHKVADEFVIKPVKTGFQEYETQINAVQTIMANTGAPIEKVNAALDELNAYADKTIYNFTEMTRNIGTFTAAGVDIDTSTAAIKGIANLSAVSGANANDAARVMYQLSQAIAAGTVKLQDWRSVENANIGGKVFQDALKDTARIHGIEIDKMIEKEGSFRETLSDGWLTSDILLETLQKFTGELSEEQLRSMGYTDEQARKIYEMGITANDAATKVKTFTQLFDTLAEARQSGWTQSWEIIIGDFEEAKGLLTMLSDRFNEAIGDSANARNLVLQQWSDLGGRTLLIESVINVLDSLEGIAWSVKNAFRDIFPEITADTLFNITSRVHEVTEGLKNLFSFSRGAHYSLADTGVGEMLDKDKFAILGPVLTSISRIFKGFFSIVDAGLYIISNFGKIVLGIFKMAAPLGSFLIGMLGNIGDYLTSIGDGIKNGTILLKSFDFLKGFFDEINSAIISLLSVFVETTEGISNNVPNIKAVFSAIFESVKGFISGIYDAIVENDYFGRAINFLKTSFLAVLMIIPAVISSLASLLRKIKQYAEENKIVERATSKVKNTISRLVEQIQSGYSSIQSFVKKLTNFIKNQDILAKTGSKAIEVFREIASGIKGFWSKLVEAFKESKNVDTSNIVGLFGKIKARLEPFQKLLPLVESPINGFKKLAAAIKNAFNSIKTAFSDGVSAIKDQIGSGSGAIKNAYQAFKEKITPIIDWIATNVDLGSIFRTLTTISALINISKFIKTLNNFGDGFKNAGERFSEALKSYFGTLKDSQKKDSIGDTLLKLAGSIGILVASLWVLSKIDQDQLNDGMLRLGAIVAGIILFFGALKVLKIADSKNINNVSKFIKNTAVSIILLTGAITLLSRMKSETVITGLLRVAEILMVLFTISKISGSGASSNGNMGFTGMAISVLILAHTLKYLAKIDPEVMAKGLIAMSAVLLELAVFTRIANGLNLSGAKRKPAFITMAISVILLVEALKGLGRMDPNRLQKGLAALGAILLEMGIFSRLLSGSSINAKGLILMLVSLGGSLLLFMEAMNRTANVSGAKMLAFSVSFGIMIGALAKTLTVLSLIPLGASIGAIVKLGGIIGLIGVFIGGIGAIAQEFPNIQGWLDSGGETLGKVGTAIGKFIQGIINPDGVSKGTDFSFESLGTELGNFATNAQPFFAKISELTEDQLNNITTLATAVTNLSVAAAMSNGKSMSGVASSLGDLGEGLTAFSNNIQDFDSDAAKNTEMSLTMLTTMYNRLPKMFGIFQLFAGMPNLELFAEGIGKVGEGLKKYSDNAKGVDVKAVAGTESGLTMLQDIYNNLEPIGGLAMIFGGEVDPFDFALGIAAMGKGLASYSESVKDVKSKNVESSAKALVELAKIHEYLPDVGGLVGKIMGDPNLAKMGEALPVLGSGLSQFSKDLGETSDFTNVSAAATALKDLAGVYEYVPDLGGLFSKFTGDQDLGKFGEQISTLGENISTFASYFANDSYGSVSEGMTNAGTIFDSLKELFTTKLSGGPEELDPTGAVTNFEGLLDKILLALELYYPNFYDTGSSLMSNLSDGANNVSHYPVNTFTFTMNSVVRSLRSYEDSFYTIGKNYTFGIANGIADGTYAVISSANSVADSAVQASQRSFDERSPSKKGYAIGAFFTEGIANGMVELASRTNSASKEVSEGAIHSAQTAMSMINSIIESGDVAPTIRPVLDLSNITNGAGQINSLLGQSRTLMESAVNVRSFNQRAMALQTGINQNGSIGKDNNRDVVEAINNLGSRIDTMNEDIKNLKIVLNTGILAGQLEPEINRRMGLRAAYEERGI